MKTVAVIMAGGRGERFWPMSRTNFPKQFLSLTGDGVSMIQHTVNRLLPLVAQEDIFVVTNRNYIGHLKKQLPRLPEANILAEPEARNTAPCIAFAATVVQQRYGDAVMLVMPSDHLVSDDALFVDALQKAIRIARQGEELVTLGIRPTYPETGYGYIRFDPQTGHGGVYEVLRFVEKPDLGRAQTYLASGSYLWNSGMFCWKSSTILDAFKTLLPEVYANLAPIRQAIDTPAFGRVLRQCYRRFPSVSIDVGIMEKAPCVSVVLARFGWDDVGSWLSLSRLAPCDDEGNVLQGTVIPLSSKNCVFAGNRRLIAGIGLEDVIVVDTEDALLICSKNNSQDVKQVLDMMREAGLAQYL